MQDSGRRLSLKEPLERAAARFDGDTVARMCGDIGRDEYARRVARTRARNDHRS